MKILQQDYVRHVFDLLLYQTKLQQTFFLSFSTLFTKQNRNKCQHPQSLFFMIQITFQQTHNIHKCEGDIEFRSTLDNKRWRVFDDTPPLFLPQSLVSFTTHLRLIARSSILDHAKYCTGLSCCIPAIERRRCVFPLYLLFSFDFDTVSFVLCRYVGLQTCHDRLLE